MRKSHTFGTRSMPLKKLQKNSKKAVKTSSLLPSATRPCEDDSDGNYSQPIHAKATLVSQTVFSMKFLNSQATSNTARLDEVVNSDHIPRNIPEHTLNTTQLSAPSDSPSASEASLTADASVNPETPSLTTIKHTITPHRPSGRKKPIDFPSLDTLPPTRLYGDDQELSGSNVPFAKDECVSQAHARRMFLRSSFAHGTWTPVAPGTAMQ